MIRARRAILTIVALLPLAANAQSVDVFANPENLQVLPGDISSAELGATMRGFAMGLGVRCENCHVGEAGAPLDTFDFASDEKAMKQKARLMLEMVMQINGDFVPRLDDIEIEERVDVRCVTCHRGLPKPMLIEDVLAERISEEGVEAAVAEYRQLRERYYGTHSYDFSEFVLPMYAQRLFASEQAEAAIGIAELNAEYYPDSYYTAFTLGELYFAAERTAEALASYERAIEINPRAAQMLAPRIEALTGD
ncbi:MAG: c-type cytochrome [Woeseiaceae bacterium]|nr:c-type cytochrome [Woeseiaceae bacterium]